MSTNTLNTSCKKRFKTEKVNVTIKFYTFEKVQVPNFMLKMKILSIWTKVSNLKVVILTKKEKDGEPPFNSTYLNYLGSTFELQKTISISLNKFAPEKNYSGQKQQKMNVTIESFILELA